MLWITFISNQHYWYILEEGKKESLLQLNRKSKIHEIKLLRLLMRKITFFYFLCISLIQVNISTRAVPGQIHYFCIVKQGMPSFKVVQEPCQSLPLLSVRLLQVGCRFGGWNSQWLLVASFRSSWLEVEEHAEAIFPVATISWIVEASGYIVVIWGSLRL